MRADGIEAVAACEGRDRGVRAAVAACEGRDQVGGGGGSVLVRVSIGDWGLECRPGARRDQNVKVCGSYHRRVGIRCAGGYFLQLGPGCPMLSDGAHYVVCAGSTLVSAGAR